MENDKPILQCLKECKKETRKLRDSKHSIPITRKYIDLLKQTWDQKESFKPRGIVDSSLLGTNLRGYYLMKLSPETHENLNELLDELAGKVGTIDKKGELYLRIYSALSKISYGLKKKNLTHTLAGLEELSEHSFKVDDPKIKKWGGLARKTLKTIPKPWEGKEVA